MEFDLEAFRVTFPAFDLVTDETVLATSVGARCFLSEQGCDCDQYSWQLMTAHLLALSVNIAAGGANGQVTSASIDKVSVTITPPPARDAFSYWLSTTPYGLQLTAMIARCSAGGLYVGGSAERSAFRSVGGTFPNRGRF